jgi:hypothetical protein
MSKPKTYYVTKYALTEGILAFDAKDCEVCIIGEGAYLSVNGHGLWISKTEWFTDLDLAQAHAQAQAGKKVRSLAKQLAKVAAIQANGAPVVVKKISS